MGVSRQTVATTGALCACALAYGGWSIAGCLGNTGSASQPPTEAYALPEAAAPDADPATPCSFGGTTCRSSEVCCYEFDPAGQAVGTGTMVCRPTGRCMGVTILQNACSSGQACAQGQDCCVSFSSHLEAGPDFGGGWYGALQTVIKGFASGHGTVTFACQAQCPETSFQSCTTGQECASAGADANVICLPAPQFGGSALSLSVCMQLTPPPLFPFCFGPPPGSPFDGAPPPMLPCPDGGFPPPPCVDPLTLLSVPCPEGGLLGGEDASDAMGAPDRSEAEGSIDGRTTDDGSGADGP
jgi:hypothetical protein